MIPWVQRALATIHADDNRCLENTVIGLKTIAQDLKDTVRRPAAAIRFLDSVALFNCVEAVTRVIDRDLVQHLWTISTGRDAIDYNIVCAVLESLYDVGQACPTSWQWSTLWVPLLGVELTRLSSASDATTVVVRPPVVSERLMERWLTKLSSFISKNQADIIISLDETIFNELCAVSSNVDKYCELEYAKLVQQLIKTYKIHMAEESHKRLYKNLICLAEQYLYDPASSSVVRPGFDMASLKRTITNFARLDKLYAILASDRLRIDLLSLFSPDVLHGP
ncbi:hypothetical protein NEOLEDRAFT_817217 [Neolentinus lepideus HHB14362 ss-1]|uniref:Uncharacterized protein n=1 Tax=Neolentinus lepideus HHB14362 ss-1 TaxID=1314782 RepID=A0A165PD88_9AGAM|nr:hypothetical protein NEOLEDRAFT_817217 [Neolentinus lepideus HHB14362 ss-1]